MAVARKGLAPLVQIAKDSGISEGSLTNWLKRAEIEDGHRPGLTEADRAELRELERRNRLLEQENEVLRRAAAYLSQANLPGKLSSRSSARWSRPALRSGCRSRWRAASWAYRLRGDTSGWPRRSPTGTGPTPT